MRKIFPLVLLFAFSFVNAQTPQKLNSAEIHQAIKKLNFLGSVLFVAAHPDDENTRLISYLANEVNARTGYLSITRGDGGQNLIGPELKELLGVIRTQELLAARRIDGGEQLFTRAIDFGYTKTPEEALDFWQKEEVLSDVVWAIRTFKPDVIINRFNHRTSGETHGQHTASALLSVEAFDKAGDASFFPEHLQFTQAFAPKRMFFNTSPWFYGSEEAFKKAVNSNFLQFDTGVYFSSKGLSNPEIAALSRSEHQSQGFGSAGSRGEQMEYLELLEGEIPENDPSLFAGIDTSWNRIEDGAKIGEMITKIELTYNFKDPAASIPALVEAYKHIQKLEDSHWKHIKSLEIKEIIASAAGLYMEALASSQTATPSEEIEINLEAINRSRTPMTLVEVILEPANIRLQPNRELNYNFDWKSRASLTLGEKAEFTSPYWLKQKGSIGLYNVPNRELIGRPQAPKTVKAIFKIEIHGVQIPYDRAIVYKYTDAVKGEIYQPFEIVPEVSAKFKEKVIIFANGKAKEVPVIITAGKDKVSGEIGLQSSGNWKIEPVTTNFSIENKGASASVLFRITPPESPSEATLSPVLKINGETYSSEIIKISYDHIPEQTVVLPAETRVVKLDIQKKGQNIGYIEGAGDAIPESLEQIGYSVTRIPAGAVTASNLAKYDAVVMGIRAYNVAEELKYSQPALLKYVENGGNLIVQYNVSRGLVVNSIGPFELDLSRDRVTEEDAPVRFIAKDHPILNVPNKITSKDFENWVQERGLYFADKWAPEYTPIISMNDTGETPKEGALLVAKHGKGHFIYTGLSFFRQFPEGVPGAYRLFANMVSLGKQ